MMHFRETKSGGKEQSKNETEKTETDLKRRDGGETEREIKCVFASHYFDACLPRLPHICTPHTS